LNFQGLRKPAFYAYQFLNRLGDEELNSSDAESWVCRGPRGVQVLLWNFTTPVTKESNQKFFNRDVPAKVVGKVTISLASMTPGTYELNIYQVGYGVNDVFADYLKLGSPANLTREQARELAEKNQGRPISSSRVRVAAGKPFLHDVLLRENDVYLLTLEK
jgi:xylan 1,4-beta-xylosidase